MRYYVTLPTKSELEIEVDQLPDGRLQIRSAEGAPIEVDAVELNGAVNVRVGDRIFDLYLDGDGDILQVNAAGARLKASVLSERDRFGSAASRASQQAGGRICAPMPGRVVKVLVAEGDVVEAGMPVIVVEAMKMENELCADNPGKVESILAEPGQNVDSGAVLVELAAAE